MRALPIALGTGLLALAAGVGLSAAQPEAVGGLKPPSDFSAISSENERSIALFTEAGKVIQHRKSLSMPAITPLISLS